MPEPALRPPMRRCSRCAACNAWYGESHILHGVDFDVARARW